MIIYKGDRDNLRRMIASVYILAPVMEFECFFMMFTNNTLV